MAIRGGKRASESLSGQVRRLKGRLGSIPVSMRFSAAAISAGGAFGSHNQDRIRFVVLIERKEHRWRGIFGQHLVFAVFNDPHDLIVGLVSPEK